MKPQLEFIDDATFWPPLPCQMCRAQDVPFCVDSGAESVGACDEHIAPVLRHLVVNERREALVIRNCAVPPLTRPGTT